MTDERMKECSKCKQEFPATTAYFHGNKRANDGLNGVCKTCNKAKSCEWRKNNPEKSRENSRVWRMNNPERQQEANKRWQNEHAEEKRAYMREYAPKHREQQAERVRRYREKHPEIIKVINSNRRSKLCAAPGKHTVDDIQAQLKRQKGRCYYAACGHCKLGKEFHVEHVVPLIRDGWNDASNIVISCPVCNAKKGKRLPHEWVEGGRLL